MEQARRYNKGKLRYELISKIATREKARVYTGGAHKYTLYKDAEGKIIKGSDISLQEAANIEVFEVVVITGKKDFLGRTYLKAPEDI